MTTLIRNIEATRQRVKSACAKCGRDSRDIRLLLATKSVSAANILLALRAGETLIGENKVQELKEKFDALKEVPHETHFIGHLQTNKIKDVVKYAQCIQSVDRLALAEKLQQRLEFENRTMEVFLQVNTSGESSKFGIAPEKALDLGRQVMHLDRIRLRGLMTIGLFSAETGQVRACFRLLKNIQRQLLDQGLPVYALSMGMSGDLETAVEEGATLVRVGTAVFGPRPYPDSFYWNARSG